MNKAHSAYRSANVDTADQGRLILIAYDVAIKHCRCALPLFGDYKKIEERTKHVFKVQEAVAELMSSLNMDTGEIAGNLYRLYDYILKRLVDSNVSNQKAHIESVLSILENLRAAWDEAIRTVRRGETPAAAAPAPESAPASSQGFAVTG